MADEKKVDESLLYSIKATTDLTLNQVQVLVDRVRVVETRLDVVEQQVGTHPPRQQMTTLDEIEADTHQIPRVGHSIRVIERTTSESRRENRWLTLGIALVVLATTAMNQCPHKGPPITEITQ